MKRLAFALLALSFTPPAEAQLFRRLFGGGQQQHCQQPVYYQAPTYYQPQAYYQPNYVAVAAVPLATVPVAVDLQSYLYSVNSAAFQSFRDYQQAKATQEPATPVAPLNASAPASTISLGVGLTGAVVLKQRCASCHTSGKIPRFFDGKGDLLAGAPLQEMLERITTDDPQQRMPPKGQLPTREAMAVLNYATSGLTSATERVATVEPTKRSNPFE